MPRIVTLTMNPAIDVSTSTGRVEPLRKLRCGASRRDAGGGGINVARVARRMGAEVIAVYPVGGFVGQLLEHLVANEGVQSVAIPVLEETREDFTVLDEMTQQQYRFVLPGPHLQGPEWMRCLKTFASLDVRPQVVCASGSLPPGAPDDFYARIAEIVRSWDAKFVLDTSGAPLRRALDKHVHLVKASLREMRELTGMALEDQPSMVEACRDLIASGRAEVIALTLGADGALLVTADRAWRAAAMPVRAVSTVGAGDSFLGAMVWALASGMTLEDAFRYGVAGGSAAILAAGTELGLAEDVRRLFKDVSIEEVPLAQARVAPA